MGRPVQKLCAASSGLNEDKMIQAEIEVRKIYTGYGESRGNNAGPKVVVDWFIAVKLDTI
jgi:hypothetical protein